MNFDMYQLDSFSTKVFAGNPAAVVPLEQWLPDSTLQAIAMENNLSETAFFVKEAEGFHLRWFTPIDEVDLCGHATLASAYVLYHHLAYSQESIRFFTLSGELTVQRESQGLRMNLPSRPAQSCELPEEISQAVGACPQWSGASNNWLLLFANEQEVLSISPDFSQLLARSDKNVIVTAPGDNCDFVSRFFAPLCGVDEDPVTGSAHCTLAPFWAERLGKDTLLARQVSARGGQLLCQVKGDRVEIVGDCVTYLKGQIFVNL
ncbi:MAG: PhzF family phenazine biosynthesis protein [Spongiibacteraceae bacterium]|nr:PhzF family phenazine biosynthesis protein [Spongiibacteraceae bacterium]MBN4055637.1 PhzF family phenazine biosynthesis protein [bacterium AH-315-K03]